MGYEAEMVPGISSFCAAASRINDSLAEKEEQIHIIPASYEIGKALELSGTKILMKAGRKLPELKRRLLEYQKYKESTEVFRSLIDKRSNYYTKVPEKRELYTEEKLENTENVTASDLLLALQKLLERKEYSKPINTKITRKELSVSERTAKIRSILKKEKRVDFLSLFDELTRPYIVVTFLSILEMAKDKEIILKQEANFGRIILERVD